MIDDSYFKNFEDHIVSMNKTHTNREMIKIHFKTIYQMIDPFILNDKMLLNEFQLKLLLHLFNISFQLEYIPSL